MKIASNVIELVGNTPLLKVFESEATVYAKLEMFNPAGSVKDRIAKNIILKAIDQKALVEGSTIVEATSGNTGIGLAAVGRSLGFKVKLVMPDTMSIERRKLMQAYGAELVLTDGALGMKGAIAKANELKEADPEHVFIASQFENLANPEIHYLTTGPEIYSQLEGNIDILVSGIGTGGTITGTGRYLKEKNPHVQIVAVEPTNSPVLSGGAPGKHKIQGIGAGFVPAVLDTTIYNEVIQITDEEAFENGRLFSNSNGLLIGISAGAALAAAKKVASRVENKGKNIVVIFPDGGDRYLSSPMYEVE